MSASFVVASSQSLSNTTNPLISGVVPVTFAAWIYVAALPAAAATICSVGSNTNSNHYLQMALNTTGTISTTTRSGGSTASATTTGTIAANTWNFVCGRWISAANRRTDVLFSTGATESVQETTSLTPTSPVNLVVGAINNNGTIQAFFGGLIGEFWWTNTDIQGSGAALNADTIWQLAYGGPFSLPYLAKDIGEYRSLRKHPSSDGDDGAEILSNVGRQTWTNTGGVTIGHHPPLPYWYVRPSQTMRNLVI